MSKSLLVLSSGSVLKADRVESISKLMTPVAKRLGFELVVVSGGESVAVHHDLAPLIEAINKQTESVCALAESNRALIAMMADDDFDPDGDAPVVRYLDDHIG